MAALGWAAYLACSWTWCIGMFLPGLLMRDFGWMGFAVFATPNIIGAAALGFFAPDGDRLAGWMEAHRPALRWFSRVTIGFHVYFVGMVGSTVLPIAPLAVMAGAVLIGGLLVVLRVSPASTPRLSMVVFVASLACIGTFVATAPALDHAAVTSPGGVPGDWAGGLAMLPVCALGFLCCPYLDLTFLLARDASGASSRRVFALGFGVLFAAMIGFTAWYAPLLPFVGTPLGGGIAAVALATHLIVQASFTVSVHTERMITTSATPRTSRGAAARLGLVVAMLLGIGGMTRVLPPLGDMAAGEVGYRVFLTFYGLVFPAYLWLVAMPHGWKPVSASRGSWIRLTTAIVLALPFYAVGFLGGPAWWTIIGVGVVLVARAVPITGVGSGGSARPEPSV